jgi:hypothetical protein
MQGLGGVDAEIKELHADWWGPSRLGGGVERSV